MSDKMREEFEAAMRLRGYTQFARRGQHYQFDDIDMLWQGFQIGRQSERDLRKDAERFHWLEDQHVERKGQYLAQNAIGDLVMFYDGSAFKSLSEAIDAIMELSQ